MSEQDETTKIMMAKIAALEAEIAPLRKAATADPRKQFAKEFITDPVGAMRRAGIPQEHVTKVLVAEALGDKADPALRALAQMGPQVAATTELAAEMAALRQRLDASETERRVSSVRESTKSTAADKKKYPHLAAALAADPSFLDGEATGDSAEATAQAAEARLARAARALGFTPPASHEDAETAGSPATGTGRKPQAHVGGNPPTASQGTARSKVGWTDEDREALRDEIVRKAERGEYDVPTHPYRPA